MDYRAEYDRWLKTVTDSLLRKELENMTEAEIEDAFYRDLSFGTGGLRGVMGAGSNRMNIHVVAKASQGLAEYLGPGASVVVGYDSRINSEIFAKVTAGVLAANGISVHIWPCLLPVPLVSYAVRQLGASAGVMITASHNPSKYNGYKVYGPDGCQITTEAADAILSKIQKVDVFLGVRNMDFAEGLAAGRIDYISDSVLTNFLSEVKQQSVLYGDKIDKTISIVYSPLNGTGLVPVTRVLRESGFANIIVVEEQRQPDGNFPTCPYPNPEIREAMELGLRYCEAAGADLLLATDPDCDRCGIAVRSEDGNYVLLTGNEVGLLLLDYICAQRSRHGHMPADPVFVKTIVTTDLAEKIAEHYGVSTRNVLTGFKYIGEVIGTLEKADRVEDYILGFEESYGYLTGSYVRDKDGVNAAFMICEMFAFYKTAGISLTSKLEQLYAEYGYCLNTLHNYAFSGSRGMAKMEEIMQSFRENVSRFDSYEIKRTLDYKQGLEGLPKSNVLKFYMDCGSVVIRPSGTEPKLKAYISITAKSRAIAEEIERRIAEDLKTTIGE